MVEMCSLGPRQNGFWKTFTNEEKKTVDYQRQRGEFFGRIGGVVHHS
jgi:hypothetical protein